MSIVISTLNRADDLARTLDSFRWLETIHPFEVIVVNGPSTDHSEEVIAAQGAKIRAYRCDVANLSTSRNLGIRAATGDIVAFIDDDGIPEPEWLAQLVAAYDDPNVGAAGGFVFDHTGHNFQYQFGTADRFGNARIDLKSASPELNFPFTFEFPHLLGTNASFRRSALLEIGGFDEEFEYFLDETDVLARIVDAGYVIAQLPNAFVHHKFAPSHLRDHNRMVKNRFPILKNKVYFCIKQGRLFAGLDGAMRAISEFFENQRREVRWLVGEGRATDSEVAELEVTIEKALERGVRQGLDTQPSKLPSLPAESAAQEFRPFPTLKPTPRLCVVLLSNDYPPHRSGGIATLTAALATALAALGHFVHVITKSEDINRVDFEHGVWVHRVVPSPHSAEEASRNGVPQHLWNWSATARDEAERIATHRVIDCIEAPIWDCEAIAFLTDRKWPVVISLHTTFYFWLESNPSKRLDPAWMSALGQPILDLEMRILVDADAIRANSSAIKKDIEDFYRVTLDEDKIHLIPHGIPNAPEHLIRSQKTVPSKVTVLFVGRLEKRKGIDVLLSSIPRVLEKYPLTVFHIVGDDSLPNDDGVFYRHSFEESTAATLPLDSVIFHGRLDDDAVAAAYANCDIFVAPSRYESFGIVYLEAMRAGKPVVACAVGGVPEVVDNTSGILVPADDASALTDAIVTLVSDPTLRQRLGNRALQAFNDRFTAQRMAEKSLFLYQAAIDRHAEKL